MSNESDRISLGAVGARKHALAYGVALITGAGSGIGRALAVELAHHDMDVAVVDLRLEAAEETADEVRRLGRAAVAIACDVSDRNDVVAMTKAANALGPISFLCANAGVSSFTPFAEISDADVDWVLGVDLLGVSDCIRAVLPGMIEAGKGHVVAVSSMSGLVPSWSPNHAPYTAAKAGVIGLMVNLQPELAACGIGCTVVCPGGVNTNIADTPRRRPARFGGPLEGRLQKPASRIEASQGFRRRSPNEVARMIVEAVLDDRLIVVTDHRMRDLFARWSAAVDSAFDAAEQFEMREAESS